ncbi:MAG: hypothetical protein QXQ66_03710 [Candidatus Hadarchaeum sp.]
MEKEERPVFVCPKCRKQIPRKIELAEKEQHVILKRGDRIKVLCPRMKFRR